MLATISVSVLLKILTPLLTHFKSLFQFSFLQEEGFPKAHSLRGVPQVAFIPDFSPPIAEKGFINLMPFNPDCSFRREGNSARLDLPASFLCTQHVISCLIINCVYFGFDNVKEHH